MAGVAKEHARLKLRATNREQDMEQNGKKLRNSFATVFVIALVAAIASAQLTEWSQAPGAHPLTGQWALIFSGVFVISGGIFVIMLYFLPAMVASARLHPNAAAIMALNLLLGWTFVGWALALVWALMRVEQAAS